MREYLGPVFYLAPLAIVLIFVASALAVHFRGKKRHKFGRQLTDHSTFMAPYNSLIYLFSAVKNTPVLKLEDFPELKPLTDHWEIIRDEALELIAGGHIAAAEKHNDIAFNSFFKRGWRRFYLKWYDDFLPSAKESCRRRWSWCSRFRRCMRRCLRCFRHIANWASIAIRLRDR
jgi:beta-hydroxylase